MPYELVDGNCVKKQSGETIKCHKTHEEAVNHLQALEANVKNSDVVEMSMRISKASYNKSEKTPMKWTAIDSDIDEDLYQESMSIELYKDFVSRIENNTPVPEQFKSVICENDWCGGTPYISIAHYKAGEDLRNVPGSVESVFIDGTRLKSKGTLNDTPMGRKVFDALREDLYMEKSGNKEHLPVRISIGFLDLEHKHIPSSVGQEFTFVRTDVGQICPLCAQGIGGKIYTKGQLVHLAMTRVPVNPRTSMNVEKSMDIKTKKDDAKSILGELADELDERSLTKEDVLVVRSEDGTEPTPAPSELKPCYDENTGGWNQECLNAVMEKYMPEIRNSIGVPVKSTTMPKPLLDAVIATLYKSNGYDVPVVEDAMPNVNVKQDGEVEKATLGGESVPHIPFKHTQDGVTITGDGNNTIPAPVKAKAEDEPEAVDNKKEEKVEMSAVDKAFALLKSQVEAGKSGAVNVEGINKAFAELGTAVEKEFAPTPTAPVTGDVETLMKSFAEMLDKAITPLRVEVATLKAQKNDTVSSGQVVKSKALTIGGYPTPENLIQRSVQTNQPVRQLSQIERIARKSTGVLHE